MKRAPILLLCCALLAGLLAGCTAPAQKAFADIPFDSADTTLVPLADAEPNAENEFYFFTDADALEKGLRALEKHFNLAEAPDGKLPLAVMAERYDAHFFENRVLLLLKRYHATEAVLQPKRLELVNGLFTLHADLPDGAAAASTYRVYLLAFDKEYMPDEAPQITVDTTAVSSTDIWSVLQTHVVIRVGERYKVVTDDAAADALLAQLRAIPLTPSDYDADAHDFGKTDAIVCGRGFYAEICAEYIGVDLQVYAPDSAYMQTVLRAFQDLPGTVKNISEHDAFEPQTVS